MEFGLPIPGLMEVSLISSDGKVVFERGYTLEEGYAQVEMFVGGYEEGMYVLKYDFEGEVHTERVVVSE